jgi:hypothetical protein
MLINVIFSGAEFMSWRGTDSTGLDRFFACLPYIVPIAGSLMYAIAFVTLLPITAPVMLPLFALGMAYGTLTGFLGQFGDLLIFFGLFLFVVRNTNISHFIRFHTMQALMISISMSIVNLFFQFAQLPIFSVLQPTGPLGIVGPTMFAAFFVLIAACYLYALFCAIQGKYGEIRWISEAAHAQTR